MCGVRRSERCALSGCQCLQLNDASLKRVRFAERCHGRRADTLGARGGGSGVKCPQLGCDRRLGLRARRRVDAQQPHARRGGQRGVRSDTVCARRRRAHYGRSHEHGERSAAGTRDCYGGIRRRSGLARALRLCRRGGERPFQVACVRA
jgi:hypothetical protein